MVELILNIIMQIIAIGLPGLFSYWVLTQLDIVFYNNDQKSGKTTLLSSLSLLNVFVVYILLSLLGLSLVSTSILELLTSFIVSVFVVLVLSIYIYPFVFKTIRQHIIEKGKKGNSVKSNYKVLPRILHERPNDKNYTQAYIFDFKNNLILEGCIGKFSYNNPELSLENEVDSTTTYKQAINVYNKTNNLNRDIYIDLERQIKMILIHF
ncbi:hypothetical protein [Staphylococcus delphini]|uniref:hypothetical protein n=1 Tax=Staphylococcus delphini TaxID=53344 RepID=UPI0021D05AB8|nr:hypothetical protein [Staphylococcus delphini]UXS57035.1 hypothetical protein MUA44_09345 [Staphylococcus delphini]